jgi:hypothetical protein
MPQFLNTFSPCTTITTACILYTAATMSVGTEAPDGYYSDGVNCYTVSSPHSSVPGNVSSVDTCPPPTPPPCSLPGTAYILSAYVVGNTNYAKFTWKDACGVTHTNWTVWAGQDQFICVQNGTVPQKTSGNGTWPANGTC